MNKTVMTVGSWTLALVLLSVGITIQAAEIDYGGSLRLRFEDKIDFNLADAEQDFLLSQLRLYFSSEFDNGDQFFIELQDSRVFGEDIKDIPSIDETKRNQPFADELDIHQLYYIKTWGGIQVKVGRQKFNLGDNRLVASLEWVNTARVHDGIRLAFGDTQSRKIDIFASRLVSIDPREFNDQSNSNNRYFDSEFHGIMVTDKEILSGNELQYWYFLRKNSDIDDTVHTFGARLLKPLGDWDLDIQGALQTGEFDGLDHRAWMFHSNIKRNIFQGTLTFSYNFASGDDDRNDGNHKTFDNLYPLNHPYYGYMDLFSLQNIHNFEVSYKKGIGKAKLRVSYQGFWLADTDDAWYSAGLAGNIGRLNVAQAAGNNVDNFVGSELDITLQYPLTKKWSVIAGYSHFFAGNYADDTGANNDADFIFLMSKISF